MRRLQLSAILLTAIGAAACQQDHEIVDLVGRDGILRFNLEFTNEANVDVDLHVITPGDEEIAWSSLTDTSGGQLDVDCFCGVENCLDGPNENIYWDYGGEAPLGSYTVFVQYFGSCDFDDEQPSSYTLRVLQAGVVSAEYTGTLNESGEEDTYTHEQSL